MRALLVCLCALVAACHEDRPCRPSTLLVSVSFKGQAIAFDALDVAVSVAGGTPKRSQVAVGSTTGNLEIEFPNGYPGGQRVDVTLVALANGAPVANGSAGTTLAPGCAQVTLALEILPPGSDLQAPQEDGGADGGTDQGVPDAAPDGCTGCGVVWLNAIHPAVARSGDTITLEGVFDTTAQVNFPGGVPVVATVLGSRRLSAVVPDGASAGPLTVSSGGATTNSVEFRRASFALGLQPFRAHYEQADGARQAPQLITGRCHHSVVRYRNWVYVTLGKKPTTVVNRVERALINADGTLGEFLDTGVDSTPEPTTVASMAVVVRDALYAFGHGNTSIPIYRAPLAADGTLGAFVSTGSYAAGDQGGGSAYALVGDSLYLIGGGNENPARATNMVSRARISYDGTLGPLQLSNTLITGRHNASVLVIGQYLYVFGGYVGTAIQATNSVERARINPDGSLGAFMSAGTLLTLRSSAGAVRLGNRVYIMGGFAGGVGYYSTVETATINPDNTLTPFTTLSGVNLSFGRGDIESATQVIGNHVYLIGGNCGAGERSFDRASIDAGGGVSPFAISGMLGTPRRGHQIAVAGNQLYVLGGFDGNGTPLASVERAEIFPDGTLGPFVAAGPLGSARAGGQSAIVGGWLYMIGGGPNSIERAPIGPDGALGAFAPVPGTPPPPGLPLVVGNSVYVYGDGTTNVSRAVVDRDAGAFGDFAALPVKLVTPRSLIGRAVLGNLVYAVGGQSDGGGLASVEQSLLDSSDAGLGNFVIPDGGGPLLSSARHSVGTLVAGSSLFAIGGSDDNGAPTAVDRAGIVAGGLVASDGGAALLGGGVIDTRAIVLGNRAYLVGGRRSAASIAEVLGATLE